MSISDTISGRGTASIADEFAYRARSVLAGLKRAAGVSRRGDAKFYVDRLARAVSCRSTEHNFGVLSLGNDDGAGSQAQASMSALCFARAHGLTYIHRPFSLVLCAETDMPTWVRTCEEYFNLGEGERHLGDDDTPIIPLDQIQLTSRTQPLIVSANHYLHYCNRDKGAWERVLPELRQKYWRHKTRRPRGNEIRLAIHMRRGDVTANNKLAANFTPSAVFVNALARIKRLTEARVPLRIELHSQGTPDMFADLVALGAELHLDVPALETHRALVEADMLIMSKGAFSHTAGILNDGIVLYDPQKYRALNGWIERAPDGGFDEAQFSQRLDTLLAARRG